MDIWRFEMSRVEDILAELDLILRHNYWKIERVYVITPDYFMKRHEESRFLLSGRGQGCAITVLALCIFLMHIACWTNNNNYCKTT